MKQDTTLCIDTSTRKAGVGVMQKSLLWESGQNHCVELMPNIVKLLALANHKVQDTTRVVVATGPGGFSALRVGISTAMGIAFGAGIPIFGANTFVLEILSAGLENTDRPVFVFLPTTKKEVSYACFEPYKKGGLKRAVLQGVGTPSELVKLVHQKKALVCGEGLSMFNLASLSPKNPPNPKEPTEEEQVFSGPLSGSIQLKRNPLHLNTLYEMGLCSLPSPLYLREPSISVSKNKLNKLKN